MSDIAEGDRVRVVNFLDDIDNEDFDLGDEGVLTYIWSGAEFPYEVRLDEHGDGYLFVEDELEGA